MDAADRERVEERTGRQVVAATPVYGGFSPAERWRTTFDDGSTAFVKTATSPFTVDALRDEVVALRQLNDVDAPFAPRLIAADVAHGRPMAVIEDLSAARWPPPWEPGDLERVQATCHALARTELPFGVRDLTPERGSWDRVSESPGAFLSTGLATAGWLEHALPMLRAAARGMPVGPSVPLHHDLRSDNLCFLGERAVFVDWSNACLGPAGLDVAFMAQSVRFEGGPLPDRFAAGQERFASAVAGFFASRAGKPPIPNAPHVRMIQHRQARIALAWAARVLGLPEPDGDWCDRSLCERDAAYAAGTLDEAGWYAWTERDLIDAYLATDDPIRASGKTGDGVDWRWSRELVLDALPAGDPVHVLDVGAANGLLMGSLERWAAERGRTVVAHGLELSERLTRVATRERPGLADRLHVGNVMTWMPPRRYDLVHLGLDAVPGPRRQELVERVLTTFLAPHGRIAIRPERAHGPEVDPIEQLAAVGFAASRVSAQHPRTGAVRLGAVLARD